MSRRGTEADLELFTRVPELRESLPRWPLVARPTPVRRLAALGGELGLEELWLKDDSGSPPVGGNKARKLEFLLADAVARGRRTLVTVGYLGTNHGLATAAAARVAGLEAALVLIEEAPSDHVRDTLLRCAALGARLRHASGELSSGPVIARALASEVRRGRAPAWIPPGGSNPLGTVGTVEAGLELAAQVERGDLPRPRYVYVPLGSAGTSAGIALGLALAGVPAVVRAVRVVDPRMASTPRGRGLGRRTLAFLRRLAPAMEPPRLPIALSCVPGFEGPGYGTETPEVLEALELARHLEALELDVTYTGRALAALVRAARARALGGPVLLWNTFHPRGAPLEGTPHWSSLPPAFHHLFRGPGEAPSTAHRGSGWC